ncbi:hypothetical protein KC337_g115 [Hortaea werneckii]|nr:hypothetical protein KC337_g115 [Hortaea werneckii]
MQRHCYSTSQDDPSNRINRHAGRALTRDDACSTPFQNLLATALHGSVSQPDNGLPHSNLERSSSVQPTFVVQRLSFSFANTCCAMNAIEHVVYSEAVQPS